MESNLRIQIILKLLIIALAAILSSCGGSNSASYHYYKKQVANEQVNFHNTLWPDEYINAFSQDWLNVPTGSDFVVKLDPLVDYSKKSVNQEFFQLAIKTRKSSTVESKGSIAISFVIDVSGSMTGEFLNDTKEALTKSVQELNSGDYISITTFNNDSKNILSNTQITSKNRSEIIQIISELSPGGGTNIGNGLIEGYTQMTKFPNHCYKRLLLLTDGQSTVNTLTPKEIAREAQVQYLEDARISTIGLGLGVNEELLRAIAKSGKGHYYFAEDGTGLTKILREDLKTTIIPVIKNINIEMTIDSDHSFKKVHGSKNSIDETKRKIKINTEELNVNDWRIFIIEIEKSSVKSRAKISALVTVENLEAEIDEVKVVSDSSSHSKGINSNVLKNTVLFANAQALIEASKLAEANENSMASNILETQINNNRIYIKINPDKEIESEIETLEKVQKIINKNDNFKKSNMLSPENGKPIEDEKLEYKSLIIKGLSLSKIALPGIWGSIIDAIIVATE
jgi:Mg-chelatase subunit ChlD